MDGPAAAARRRARLRPRARPAGRRAARGPARRGAHRAAPAGRARPARLRRAAVNGVLRLVGAHVRVPVELHDCLFTQAPDLRMAEFSGLALTGCRVPGLRAGNLRVAADLLLNDGFTAHGPVDLTDAHVGGSLRLSAGRLTAAGGRALIADRVVVEGTCYARRLSEQRGAAAAGRAHHRQHRPRRRGRHEPDRRRHRPHRHRRRRQPAGRPPRRRSRPRLRRRRARAARRRADRRGPDVLRRPHRQPLPPRPAGGGRGGQPHAGAARRDRRRRSVHRRRPGAGRGEPGARRRGAHHRDGPVAQRVRRRISCGCRVRGWTARRAPRTGASRCSPTASRWVATWRAATTAGARSPAPGRCG